MTNWSVLFSCYCLHLQMDLYNSMVKKEGKDGQEEARRAYKAARQDTDQAAELTLGRKVSSALINRVT